ncbi:MAG TPA: hypothetical protein VMM83_01190 [Longimicrobiales bacterium]|nr:hypothetical protein [Longimicrobiales bacterium]
MNQNGNGNGNADDILRRLEERAVRDAAERSADEAEAPIDIIREAGGEGEDGPARDLTFAGYVETHDRVPAFEGSDGQPYTVDIDTEETGDADRPWAGFLVFVRWAATGAGIMGHVVSEDVVWGKSEDDARARALDLTLYELKSELDRAIERHRSLLEE